MAYPASTSVPAQTLDAVDRLALNLKAFCQRRKAEMAAGNVPSTTIFDVVINLRSARSQLQAAASVPGIAAYAQAQKGNPSLDIVAEFTAMVNAIDGVVSWVVANFPKDGTGTYLLAQTMGAEGPVDRQFSPAQTAGLRTALDSVINAIV